MSQRVVLRMRAIFGLGFVGFGIVVLWRLAVAPGPLQSKVIGGMLGVVLLALGITRIATYLRWQRTQSP